MDRIDISFICEKIDTSKSMRIEYKTIDKKYKITTDDYTQTYYNEEGNLFSNIKDVKKYIIDFYKNDFKNFDVIYFDKLDKVLLFYANPSYYGINFNYNNMILKREKKFKSKFFKTLNNKLIELKKYYSDSYIENFEEPYNIDDRNKLTFSYEIRETGENYMSDIFRYHLIPKYNLIPTWDIIYSKEPYGNFNIEYVKYKCSKNYILGHKISNILENYNDNYVIKLKIDGYTKKYKYINEDIIIEIQNKITNHLNKIHNKSLKNLIKNTNNNITKTFPIELVNEILKHI